MTTVTLSISEFFSLKNELEGMEGRTGLLKQSLPLPVKFKLLQVYKRVSEVVTDIDKVQKDTIMKYGKEMENGNFLVSTESEFYEECTNQLNDLFKTEQELTVPEFTLEMFNIETDEIYPVFLDKLIKVEENTD
jgi:hypothetical protein